MASKMHKPSDAMNFSVTTPSNETGFDFPLSPTEAGKFDFYRVHLNNQAHRNESMFSDYSEPNSSVDTNRRWTPMANVKESTLHSSSSSNSLLPTKKSATDVDVFPSNARPLNKPIQTVASFSTLTDAVKNAMQRGGFMTGTNPLRRPASGTTLSSKDLNHLSPQSM